MAFDPLSDSTRKYRTSLVAVASSLLAVQIFRVRITELPVAGIKIELIDQLIPVALTLSLIYFVISFGVCLADDILNFQGSIFIDERVKKSVENIKSGEQLFAKYLSDILQRYLQKDDAKAIADELGGYMFVVSPDPEQRIAERGAELLKPHRKGKILADTTHTELIENIKRSYRAARRDHPLVSSIGKTDWSLRSYYYFRLFRIYVLEAAFPFVLAAFAFAARISGDFNGALQRLLSVV